MLQEARLGLTFDVDWAPDWCVELCADLVCNTNGCATFFVTHESDILADLRKRDGIELGIHPNLLPGSTHGEGTEVVLDHCVSLVPEARAMRTHGLVQSTPMFMTVYRKYPQIETDLSLFLPFHSHLTPTKMFLGGDGHYLTRVPYNWEDDVMAEWPGWDWAATHVVVPGLNVFNFHPIHVALNSATPDNYRAIKQVLGGRPLHSLLRRDVEPFVNHGAGARTFLDSVLASSDVAASETASQLARVNIGAAG